LCHLSSSGALAGLCVHFSGRSVSGSSGSVAKPKIYETDVVASPAAVTLSDWISWRPVCARHVAA
jgi:hypothetical protein